MKINQVRNDTVQDVPCLEELDPLKRVRDLLHALEAVPVSGGGKCPYSHVMKLGKILL